MTRPYRRRPTISRPRDLLLTAGFLFLLILVAARLDPSGEDASFSGPLRVIDGDTLALGSERLRLSGIDAPEIMQTCRRTDGSEWPCGRAAKDSLGALMRDGQARGAAPECHGAAMDQYRRRLVTCTINGDNLNGRMVRDGYAIGTGLLTFRREQSLAEAERVGIWSGTFETPRAYRKRMDAAAENKDMRDIWLKLKEMLALHWL
ncbi:thermonuclease family protein [Rhizobium sp. 0TCS1.26]|uniref:thermonuclease family protein n=1 Tax=Rhizobium sp. 0TCS1.26 TaxID=3142623 RepID=UPI003D2E1B51